ncbi:MAG: PRC-barrel domain-containing protein [Pseudorhodoplanes sp.]
MNRTWIVTAAVGSLLVAGPALAQTSTTTTPAPAATTSTPSMSTTAQWRASKFSGLDIYNDKDEKIGDVSELMLDESGKIDSVIISVGGFLGMGQHDVAVKFSDLRFMAEPHRNRATTASGATTTTTTTNTATSAASTEKKDYPEYAVLPNATKESLKAMPQFKY